MGEHLSYKEEVMGSSPISCSKRGYSLSGKMSAFQAEVEGSTSLYPLQLLFKKHACSPTAETIGLEPMCCEFESRQAYAPIAQLAEAAE